MARLTVRYRKRLQRWFKFTNNRWMPFASRPIISRLNSQPTSGNDGSIALDESEQGPLE